MNRSYVAFLFVAVCACGKGGGGGGGGGAAGTSQAEIQLGQIKKALKAQWVETNSYPTASTGLVPPTACCSTASKKCAPDRSLWVGSPWEELDFSVGEAGDFQYSYESADGKTFTATAVGDPGCKGNPVTLTLQGVTTPDGSPDIVLMK